MSERHDWRDAELAANHLTADERRTLLLLTRLPFLWPVVIAQLAGLRGTASVYRCLARMEAAGLVARLRVALRPGRSPGLLYLTDLGLATVAFDQEVDPGDLARRNRLRRADLLALLPGLPHLLASYSLLGALAVSRAGRPNLLVWERPWRRCFYPLRAKTRVTVVLPAYAALAWGDDSADFCLLPDLGATPIRAYRLTLDRLLRLGTIQNGTIPRLVIATSGMTRAAAWNRMLEDVSRGRGALPIPVWTTTWNELGQGVDSRAKHLVVAEPMQRLRLSPLNPRHPSRPIPRPVMAPLEQSDPVVSGVASLGQMALDLTSDDRHLLQLVGSHPFQPLEHLAALLNCSLAWARTRRNRLNAVGLMRRLRPDEVGKQATSELVELTVDGLRLLAAQLGLSLMAAVHASGLAGGGPKRPIGGRRLLLRNLAHTLGADAVFVQFHRAARRQHAAGRDDALVEWRNAANCRHRHVQPDGYGIYRRAGHLHGFFLEYDRGTMSDRDYRKKIAGYAAYRDGGQFLQDYDGFPTILVVTTNEAAEERIAQATHSMALIRHSPLPLLMTTEGRIRPNSTNPEGVLGAIWRKPDEEVYERCYWYQ